MLNDQTFEFSQAILKLKKSLRFTMRQSGGRTEYLVEDEVSGRFFRIGLPQYTFLTMLDGRRTVSTALMKTATLLREHAIDETDAASLCKWAIESGLIESETGNSALRRSEQHELLQKRQLVSYLNPMMFRVPCFNPDAIVTRLTRFFGFTVSPLGLLIWVSVVVWGFLQLAQCWNDFYANRISSFGSIDLVWIAVTWFVLKFFHELAHSLVCKKYGGRVHSFGVMILLLIPLPYVDVTSSWRFDNKWKRILTSAAGMMAEVFIAAIACVVWAASNPGPIQYHAGNVIISATLHTLLFNINPLMRFDGYYMLADFLEIPNLATHGRQWLKGTFKRIYFGNKPSPLKETGFRGLAVRLYGILAMLWFFLIAIGLSLAASSLVEGFGLMVAIIGCLMWIGIPLFKLCHYFLLGTKTEKPNRFWFTAATTCTAMALAGLFYLCPAPAIVTAPVVIQYEPLSIVRTNTKGFASEIHVVDGQFVDKGEVLMTLENPELTQELESLGFDIQISELKINTLFKKGEISKVQLEQESLASMMSRKTELESQIRDLNVYAPQSGTVIARNLDAQQGKYFQPGTELLSIASEGEVHAVALVRQTDLEWVTLDDNVEILMWGRYRDSVIKGDVSNIDPRARADLPHEAFAANVGGPLAVVPRAQVEGKPESVSESEEDKWMLTNPRVRVEISLGEKIRSELASGQSGRMTIRGREENLGTYIVANFVRFVRENNVRTHGL